jgi:hypothetical protein
MIKKGKPPKTRDFLGLVKCDEPYWDIFFWSSRKEHGTDSNGFTDRMYYKMPELVRWVDLPPVGL